MSMQNLPKNVVCAGMRETKRSTIPGFTLIELLIMVAIVGILGAIATPLYSDYINRARIVRAIAEIKEISKLISTYKLDNNKYPESLHEVGYVAFNDPWGAPYQYLNIQTMGKNGKPRKDKFIHPINSDYDLYSKGKDGQSQPPLTAHISKDDIIRANDGAYIGLASEF